MVTAQGLKYFRVFNSEVEDFSKYLNGESIENGGMDRFSVWMAEFESQSVELPLECLNYEVQKSLGELIERVDKFITNSDTYDEVKV